MFRNTKHRAYPRVRRVVAAGGALALVAAVTVGVTTASAAGPTLTTLTTDTFQNATTASTGWKVISGGATNACLTAGNNTTQTPIANCSSTAIDSNGSGALRLTNNSFSQVGTVYNTTSIPTSQGVDVRFNTYQYNGSGADGIAFILAATDPTNPAPPATTGPLGGSLGYSATSTVSGVSNGYLGFGVDVFGNYRNSQFGGNGCATTAASPQNVTVRGPGNGTSGYCILGTTQVASGALDSAGATTRPAAVPVEIALNPNSASSTTSTNLTVPARSWLITFTPLGGSRQTLTGSLPTAATLAGYGFPASWYDPSTGLPYQLTFGWAASTGASTEIHEINTLASTTLNGQLPSFQLGIADNESGRMLAGSSAVFSVTPTLDPNQGSEAQAATVTVNFPTGFTPTNPTTTDYSCTTTGRVVSCTYTPTGTLAPGFVFPTLTIPTAIATGTTGTKTVTAKVSSRDANPGSATDSVSVVTFGATATPTSTGHGNAVTLGGTNLPSNATGSITFTSGATTLCTATLPTTTCSTSSSLAAGSYPVTATYSGDSNYSSVSATTSFSITQGSTSLTAGVSSPTVPYGTADTLSFSGLPADATGSVVFKRGTTTLCTVSDITAASSCSSPTSAAVGNYPVTATYSGDGNYTGSSALTSYAVVKADAPAFTAAAADATEQYGSPNTLSFSGLAPGSTGSVSFVSGARTLCTISDVTTTTSCATDPSLVVGDYPVTVSYSGDSNHNSATAPTTYSVVPQPTAITAAPSDPTIPFGTSDTLTAGNLPSGATGSVTFVSGARTLCTIPDITTASSCATDIDLPATGYPVTATYSGDSNFTGSTANTSFVVSRSTPVQFTANAVPGVELYGTATSLVFSGLPAAATGSVTFTSGSTVLCTVDDVTTTSGCTTPDTLDPGTYLVVASYSGDGNFNPETTDTTFSVVKAETAVVAAATDPSVTYGAAETLSYGGLPVDATGSVTFTTTGGAVLCTIEDITTTSSCTVPGGRDTGTYPVTATYSGDAHYVSSSDNTSFDITKADTNLVASVSDPSVPFGTPTTLSFSGLPAGATGSVTFTSAGTTLCTVDDVTAASSCTSPATAAVDHYPVTATYSGDGDHNGSTDTTAYDVVKAATDITARVGDPTIVFGADQTLSITGLPDDAHGSVTFSLNGDNYCTIPDVSVTTECTVSGVPAGSWDVVATYSGDDSYLGSSATTSFTVTKAPTAVQASAEQSNITYGDGNVLDFSGLPFGANGSVSFYSGDTLLCTAQLAVPLLRANAAATPDGSIGTSGSCLVQAGLPAGDYPVVAIYSGDDDYQPSQASTGFVVAKAPVALTASADPTSTAFPGQVTLSAAGVPDNADGTITFTAGGQTLCTATLPDTSCQTDQGLAVADYAVTATFSGDDNYLTATAETSFTIVKADVAIAAHVKAGSVAFGTAQTLSVTGLPDGATGTVTFSSGGKTLCTATLPATSCDTSATLPAGTYPVTATYSGDAGFNGATATTTFEVAKAKGPVPGGPSHVTDGGTGTFTVNVPPGATGTVTFSAGGTVLCTVTLPATSCTPTIDLPPGTYQVTATYSGDANHDPSISVLDETLTVAAAPTTPPTTPSPTSTSTSSVSPTTVTTSTSTVVTSVTTTSNQGGGTLPNTGVDAFDQLKWGLLLLLAGVGVMVLSMRRRRSAAKHR